MSLSKLESLPNEILSDIIENYINGVDILMAFNYQLNQRFTTLINQCHRLRFNFIQCRKDDFSFCMGLLPAYVNKIEELRLSEKDTPGQIYAFLSFFPSFTLFKRLHTLYLQFDSTTVHQGRFERALYSLSSMSITNLSIDMINADGSFSSAPDFIHIFQIKTLKRLHLVSNRFFMTLDALSNMSSNIEYLSIPPKHFQLHHLQSIFQWAPRLKYLNMGITYDSVSYEKSNQISKRNIIPKTILHTLILSFRDGDQTTLDMLAPYLSAMPDLSRLEIIGCSSKLINGNMWELFLETSLPVLKHFSLRIILAYLQRVHIRNLLESFQNSFWLSRENFNVIITNQQGSANKLLDELSRETPVAYDLNPAVIGCEIVPVRAINNSIGMLKDIAILRFFGKCDIALCHHYFENVNCLIVDTMNESLLKWMTKYVNCERITELNITVLFKDIGGLDLLLTNLPYLNSLRTTIDLLINNRNIFDKKMHCLKRLDISSTQHAFNEEVISIIAKLFPYIGHIQINTLDIHNVPLLKTYLPHLRSLTVDIARDYPSNYSYYGRPAWESELRKKNNFFFQCKENSLSIWMDETAYDQPFWTKYVQIPPQSVAASAATVVTSNTQKKKKFPFFRWFN